MKPFLFLLLTAGLLLHTMPLAAAPDNPVPPSPAAGLEAVFTGTHLSLYTSGVSLNIGRNKKSGVWNLPSRKVTEMWVQRNGDADLIRLDPYRYQGQLVRLLKDYPEVHNYIKDKDFLYKNLAEEIELLDGHLLKVQKVRQEKPRIMTNQELILGE